MRRDIVVLIVCIMVIGVVIGMTNFAGAQKNQRLDYMPPVNSTFTFHVVSVGDKTATLSLWKLPGESTEIHQYKGIVENVKGATKEKVIENSEPMTCALWMVTDPSDPKFYGNYYYAIKDNTLSYFLEKQSTGEINWYQSPLKAMSFPLKVGDSWQGKCDFYTNVPNTGDFLSPTYESKDLMSDSMEIKGNVEKKENITTDAGTFECYKVTTIFTTHTGSGLTKATTNITTDRWWSPNLNYFVKEHNAIEMKTMIGSRSGTIDKEVISYKIS